MRSDCGMLQVILMTVIDTCKTCSSILWFGANLSFRPCDATVNKFLPRAVIGRMVTGNTAKLPETEELISGKSSNLTVILRSNLATMRFAASPCRSSVIILHVFYLIVNFKFLDQ